MASLRVAVNNSYIYMETNSIGCKLDSCLQREDYLTEEAWTRLRLTLTRDAGGNTWFGGRVISSKKYGWYGNLTAFII
jgi:hypothetical protein